MQTIPQGDLPRNAYNDPDPLTGTDFDRLPPVTLGGPTCGHCGHQGTPAEPVTLEYRRVHDTCSIWVLRCTDSQACWARWDTANGLVAPETERRAVA